MSGLKISTKWYSWIILFILDLSPFDETIFIDADCLAYRDLNGLWDIFKESPDFGILGYVHEEEMWWKKENLGELKDKVHFNLTCQGGIYYVRNNGKDIKTFLDMFSFIKERYPDYKFEFSPKVVMDENLAVLGLVPVRGWKDFFAYYPMIKSLDLDIRTGTLACEYSGFPGEVYKDLYLLHWGTKATVTEWLYNREVFRLRERPLKGSELARLVFIRFRCMAIKIWWRIKPLVPQKIIDMIFKGGRFAGITPLSEK